MRFRRAALLLAIALHVGSAHAEEATATSASHGTEAVATLGPLVDRLTADDLGTRRAAAAELGKLGKDDVGAIAIELAAARKAPTSAITSALKPIRAGGDLATSLVDTKTDSGPGYRAAVTTAVLLRTLTKIGTTPAVRQLVMVAGDHNGVFRPEIAEHLKTLGDKATPALLETKKETASLRNWAFSQLEGMGKRVPADAVQTQDNQVLADVLRAFANVHDVDALPVLLSFVNSDRILVRNAAREAVLQYGQDASTKLREAYSNLTGKPPADGLPATKIANDLFSAYDRLRLQDVYALVDEGLAKEKEGKLDEAVAAFDKVLARQPMLERRGEMVPAYLAHAQSLEESDPPRALAELRKALRLWPDSARAPQIEAEIVYLEGKDLLGRGITDPDPFARALALDPTHAKARAELTRIEDSRVEREGKIRIYAAVAVSIFVAVVGLVLFGGHRARRRARRARA